MLQLRGQTESRLFKQPIINKRNNHLQQARGGQQVLNTQQVLSTQETPDVQLTKINLTPFNKT